MAGLLRYCFHHYCPPHLSNSTLKENASVLLSIFTPTYQGLTPQRKIRNLTRKNKKFDNTGM